MTKPAQGVRYRWILPTTQILICAIILWPLRSTLLTKEVPIQFTFDISTIPSGQQSSASSRFNLQTDLDSPELSRFIRNTELRLWTPALLNIPVVLIDLPYVIHNPAKTEWIPKGMDFKRWRTISWPIVGLIFWWIVGRGIEALIATRRNVIDPRIGWVEAGVGVLLLLWGAIVLMLPLCAGDLGSDVPWVLICGSGILWALLGGAIVMAKIGQRGVRLRLSDMQISDAS